MLSVSRLRPTPGADNTGDGDGDDASENEDEGNDGDARKLPSTSDPSLSAAALWSSSLPSLAALTSGDRIGPKFSAAIDARRFTAARGVGEGNGAMPPATDEPAHPLTHSP